MARQGKLSTLTTAEIQKELRRRSRQVGTLVRRRNRLQAKLAKLDDAIRLMGGAVGGLTRAGAPRRRAKNDVSLVDALAQTLKGKTMGVTEAADAVRHSGYKTTAANFRTMVNAALIKHRKVFRKVSRGQYTAA